MAHVLVLGAGLGGTMPAYELRHILKKEYKISVVTEGGTSTFVPSDPRVAVAWRDRQAVKVDLSRTVAQRWVALHREGAKRIHPVGPRVEITDGQSIDYDFLVSATGPELTFDEIEGLGPDCHTSSACQLDHALEAKRTFDALVAKPGPVVGGAVQGASFFGPAYEFAFILDKALREANVGNRVPMTFITSEPHIGHLDLDGVANTKGLLESELPQHHIKWITNARVDRVEPGTMHVSEIAEDSSIAKAHLPRTFSMLLPTFCGVAAVRDIKGLKNPHNFVLIDKHQQNPTYPDVFEIGGCARNRRRGKQPRRSVRRRWAS